MEAGRLARCFCRRLGKRQRDPDQGNAVRRCRRGWTQRKPQNGVMALDRTRAEGGVTDSEFVAQTRQMRQ